MLILDCNETIQMCCDMAPFLRIIHLLITLVQFTVPVILIVLGSIDMFKAMTKNDEKSGSDLSKTFGKRLLYGVIIFFVPIIIEYILSFVSDMVKDNNGDVPDGLTSWIDCWVGIEDGDYCSSNGCSNIYE